MIHKRLTTVWRGGASRGWAPPADVLLQRSPLNHPREAEKFRCTSQRLFQQQTGMGHMTAFSLTGHAPRSASGGGGCRWWSGCEDGWKHLGSTETSAPPVGEEQQQRKVRRCLGERVLRRARSGTGDDDESGRGRLLACLAQGGLLGGPREHSGRVEVVDPGLEEAGSQAQTRGLLRLQLQPVLALTHPGEGAGHVCSLRAETHAGEASAGAREVDACSPQDTNLLLLCCSSMTTSILAVAQLDSVRVTGTTHRLGRGNSVLAPLLAGRGTAPSPFPPPKRLMDSC